MGSKLQVGKIAPDILERLLSEYTGKGKGVLVGAGIGEDATVIDMGHTYLVAKTDPITHVTTEIGHYAVNINANDIAAMGGKPLWFLATILLPESGSVEDLERIFSQLSASCESLGVVYCGGHTEVTSSVRNPVVIGQMLGEVAKAHLKPSSGACQGDHLLMTKSAAIEATAIIALEKDKDFAMPLDSELINRAKDYLFHPGISVVKEACIVAPIKGVHALHDPTEGGIATGIFEMASASELGVEIIFENIPISEETRKLCELCCVDPLGTFASGSLLIAASSSVSQKVINDLEKEGITASRIGEMVAKENGMKLIKEGKGLPLPVYHQDELSRIFG